jgi:hypothetical protein
MARFTSSARRKRHLRALASARPTLAARWNIGSEEDFSFVLKGKIPGISGELNLERRGTDRSPAAKATTMLILVAGACLAAITIAVICKLVTAPALLSAIAALAAFASVLITSTIISFRRDATARSRQEVTPSHLALDRVRRYGGDGTAQPLTRGPRT